MTRRYLAGPGVRRRIAGITVVVIAVLTTGCANKVDPGGRADEGSRVRAADSNGPPNGPPNGSSTEPSTVSSSGPGADAVAAYRAWLRALAAEDATAACARHAPDFTIELRQRAILQHRAALGDPCTGFVALLWEEPAPKTDPASIEVTQLTGEDALLAVDFPRSTRPCG